MENVTVGLGAKFETMPSGLGGVELGREVCFSGAKRADLSPEVLAEASFEGELIFGGLGKAAGNFERSVSLADLIIERGAQGEFCGEGNGEREGG